MKPALVFGPNVADTLRDGMAKELHLRYGHDVDIAPTEWKTFPGGEATVRLAANVRGRDVYVVQSTNGPTNLMAGKLILQAVSLASAGRLTAVIPYYGYARQDRKDQPRTTITAKLVAQEIQAAMGVSQPRHIIMLHPHFPQLQGFFDIPVDAVHPMREFVAEIEQMRAEGQPIVIVAPDLGAATLADELTKRLRADLAIVRKRRDLVTGQLGEPTFIGEVENRCCILVDDMIDTCGTIRSGAQALHEHGASSVRVCATHPVLSASAEENIDAARIEQLVVSDSLPFDTTRFRGRTKIMGCAYLLATAVWCNNTDNSLSELLA